MTRLKIVDVMSFEEIVSFALQHNQTGILKG